MCGLGHSHEQPAFGGHGTLQYPYGLMGGGGQFNVGSKIWGRRCRGTLVVMQCPDYPLLRSRHIIKWNHELSPLPLPLPVALHFPSQLKTCADTIEESGHNIPKKEKNARTATVALLPHMTLQKLDILRNPVKTPRTVWRTTLHAESWPMRKCLEDLPDDFMASLACTPHKLILIEILPIKRTKLYLDALVM